MKRLFFVFIFLNSILFSKDQIDSYVKNLFDDWQLSYSSNSKHGFVHETQFGSNQNDQDQFVKISSGKNMPSVLDNYSYVAQQMIKEETSCQQTYQMNLQQKRYLLSHSYKEIVSKLLACKHLSGEQIWSLWQEYKNKRCWDWNNEKVYTENDLKDALEKRKRDKQKQDQADEKRRADEQKRIEHQKLLQTYDSKILQNFDYVSSYQNHRQQALQQTVFDGGKKHVKKHDIDVQTKAFMQAQGIDHRQFENLSGTVFSHQLFQECADHYKKAAKVVYEYGLKNSVIIPHLLEFTKAAFVGTQHEQFALAVTLSDIAEILADISVGACKGIIKYGANLIDLARDPKQIVVAAKHLAGSLAKVLETLGGALVSYDQEGFAGITNLQACQASFGHDMILFNQICDVSKRNFVEWSQKSSLEDKAQAVSEMIVDCLITPFIVGKTMKVCGGILVKAKEAVNFARAIELAEELGLGFMEAEELLLATEVGVQKLPASVGEIEPAMTSFIESEVNTAIQGLELSVLKDLAPFVEEFGKMGGVIPLENKIFKNKFKEILKQLEKQLKDPMLEQIVKTYGEKIIDNKKVRAYLEHICNFELGLKKSKIAGGYILDVGGGHLSGVCEALEQTGLIKIVGKNKLSNGVIDYTMQDIFTGNPIYKTVLPEEWVAEKIGNIVWEVFETGTDIITQKNWFKYKNIEGVDISLYLRTIKQQGNALDLIEIVTLLPYKISSGAA